jgi:hypothetical protein
MVGQMVIHAQGVDATVARKLWLYSMFVDPLVALAAFADHLGARWVSNVVQKSYSLLSYLGLVLNRVHDYKTRELTFPCQTRTREGP